MGKCPDSRGMEASFSIFLPFLTHSQSSLSLFSCLSMLLLFVAIHLRFLSAR